MGDSRVFEYTEDSIVSRYMPDGMMDVPAVSKLPTLLMEEGTGSEIARLAWLSHIEQSGREYHFRYTLDPDVPALTNADIYDIATALKIHEWEFSRNHWAIKEADLSYVLMTHQLAKLPKPTVFKLSENPVDPKLISLMMPFSGGFGQVYQTIKTAVEAAGYTCKRADDFWLHSHIMEDIIELICTSGIVICDLSGKNPNVFYEAGIAHALGKEVILITQSMDDVPFDLRALRCITYLNNGEGCTKLAEDVVARLQTLAV